MQLYYTIGITNNVCFFLAHQPNYQVVLHPVIILPGSKKARDVSDYFPSVIVTNEVLDSSLLTLMACSSSFRNWSICAALSSSLSVV